MYDRRDRFVADSIATASPQHLLCLLYDRLALDVQRAIVALDDDDRTAAAGHAKHAQDIVFELRSTLDTTKWDGGPALASLYAWIIGELGKVVVHGDRDAASVALATIDPLREAWKAAAIEAPATAPGKVSVIV